MDNLLSGLIGAIIGSIIGFLGSVVLTWKAQRSERKGAARAVLAEMFLNAERALSAESTLITHQFSDSAWREQLPLIAHLLTWPQLKVLISAYDSGARAFENAVDSLQEIRGRPNEAFDELRRDKELLKVRDSLRTIAREWLSAVETLQRVAIRRKDRPTLEADLEKLKARARSAGNI